MLLQHRLASRPARAAGSRRGRPLPFQGSRLPSHVAASAAAQVAEAPAASTSGPRPGLDGRPNIMSLLRSRGLIQEAAEEA
ncbi:hypothetical protein HYH02_013029 [Chlamydomonas schloesseri]|uniref:Uncharacterized protein n=1 Tax=Chlamydomonas schloesseri TaxID=2026947 RepID=A0A835SSC2_9CHLO|nr:hypothetical protein HYH02_013029 [Chlamydomonas schloesseri]|eukprot:KAG2432309.1 hypothetical protein HYH02_013029 [Chlamydomonas schloesseri]